VSFILHLESLDHSFVFAPFVCISSPLTILLFLLITTYYYPIQFSPVKVSETLLFIQNEIDELQVNLIRRSFITMIKRSAK